jgi:molecular chaperone DnaK (HSP70)
MKKNKNLDTDIKTNPRALIRLKTEVERAKRDLSEV